jgi:hypothetical protein
MWVVIPGEYVEIYEVICVLGLVFYSGIGCSRRFWMECRRWDGALVLVEEKGNLNLDSEICRDV